MKKKRARISAEPKSVRRRRPVPRRTPREPAGHAAVPAPANRFDPKAFGRGPACVLGMGRSGIAVANLLAKKGFKVLVSDPKSHKEIRPLARKLDGRVRWEAGAHSDRVLKCRFAVKSPGIASNAPVLARLAQANIPVFSELECALAFSRCREIVAITGTNGKSTTTLLAAEIFKAGRRRVHVAGNIGVPAAAVAPKAGEKDVLVLEASSYQLEDSRHFHPSAAAVLNVTADHLEHHGGMDRYVAAKARVFRRQHRGDVCVFNANDPIAVGLARQCPGRKLFFSHAPSTLSHAWIDGGRLLLRLPGAKKTVLLFPPDLPGVHNLENAMAAALIALDRGVAPQAVQRAFKKFKGLEHRLEGCGRLRGMRCVNDSKATNVESAVTALKALSPEGASSPSILLILGGLHKGFPYSPLRPFLGSSVKGILTIGGAARKIEEDLGGSVPIFPCETLEVAVDTAARIGQRGDTLLLSPACASFDQFKDFEDRGRRFKDLVAQAARKAP